MLTAQEFLDIYDQFSVVSIGKIDYWISFSATSFVVEKLWGVHYNLGIGLATAHFLEMEWLQKAQTAANAVKIASGEGGTNLNNFDNDFQLTTWGRRFLHFREDLRKGAISNTGNEPFQGERNLGISGCVF